MDYFLAPVATAISASKRQRNNQDFDSYSFFSHDLVDFLAANRTEILLVRELPLGTHSFDQQLRALFAETYATFLNLPTDDFTIYLFVNLAISDFDFILHNQRVPKKAELQAGIQKMSKFFQ